MNPSNGPKKPKWWTDSLETSWNGVKAEAIAGWDKVVGTQRKLDKGIAEEAIAFGHGARQVYQKIEVWGSELEDKLKADWKEAGGDAERAWDKVSAAVRHGWERVIAAVTPASSAKPPAP